MLLRGPGGYPGEERKEQKAKRHGGKSLINQYRTTLVPFHRSECAADHVAEAKTEGGAVPHCCADQESLKLMLDRVEAASVSMRNGVPVPSPPPLPFHTRSRVVWPEVNLWPQTGWQDYGTPCPSGGTRSEV